MSETTAPADDPGYDDSREPCLCCGCTTDACLCGCCCGPTPRIQRGYGSPPPLPARPAEPPGELLSDEWWTNLFRTTADAVDYVPYAAASEYPVPHVAAFRASAEPLLAPLLAKLRAAEAREAIARIEGCAGALNAEVHEMEDDEDAQLLARRAIQWEQEADALRRALDGS